MQEEAGCTVQRESLQLVAMRDPRAVTVSTYFHLIRTGDHLGSLDDFFQKYLPSLCMWISARYFFFTEIMADESELFWYADHEADPMEWHGRALSFFGLALPLDVVVHMAQVDSNGVGDLIGVEKGIDSHPGGSEAVNRTFRDELGPGSLSMMDDVMRTWLPPIILGRFGLLPAA